MELLEKNLKNEKQNYLNVEIKDKKSNEPKKLPMNKDNNKKLNLEINDSSMERILKKERIKQNKEKAKEIEKKAKLNSTTNIRKVEKKIIKNKSTFDKIYFNNENNTNKSSKTNTNIDNKNILQINLNNSNNNPIKINTKLSNRCIHTKFGNLEDNEGKST